MVVDGSYNFHKESTAFLVWMLDTRSSARNSVRAYGGRVALFLSWARRHGIEWRTITMTQLTWYKRWLEETPPGARESIPSGLRSEARTRTGSTVNAHITAVSEFLRFAAREGIIEERVAGQLSRPKYLSYLPRDFNEGEGGQFRTVRARELVARETQPALQFLTDDQVDEVANSTTNARDRFLVRGLRATGLRIGEQLGLRRTDMHLLPTSLHLGCNFTGAHIHVVRRDDNDNHAVAKSKRTRVVPVDNEYAADYREYQYERANYSEADSQDLVFVNLFHSPVGRGWGYRAAKNLFERISVRVGFEARPHMLRHSFATALRQQDTPIEVVSELLGHASLQSTGIYLHPQAQAMRDAVSRVSRYRLRAGE